MHELSIIIITHNNYMLKNGSLETALLALENQNTTNFDVVVVDNNSEITDYHRFMRFISSHFLSFELFVIRNNSNSIARGRNIGVRNAKGKKVLFLDDDVILFDPETINKVISKTHNSIYAFSAIRDWTPKGWYELNKSELDFHLKTQVSYNIPTANPLPSVRKKDNLRHLLRTYIGNFGCVDKKTLESIGLWDERFIGYGLEDDCLTLSLYLKFGEPVRLDDIHVIHIWHEIQSDYYVQLNENKRIFNSVLKKQGIKSFHIGSLLYGDGVIIEYLSIILSKGYPFVNHYIMCVKKT
jgi:glycosyltransferase involved in cell wall biosynthesis